jgi:hypothetical protein
MKHLILLVAALALVLGAGGAAAIRTSQRADGPVYTVAEVQAHLERNPGAWVGRTLLVRGMVGGEPAYDPSPSLVDASASPAVDPLPLAREGPDPLWAFLRCLPWLASLAPRAQALHWGEAAVYRVRVQAQTQTYCGASVCYEAVLLDAASAALGEG